MLIKFTPESSPTPKQPLSFETVSNIEKTKVRSIIINAFPFLSSQGVRAFLQHAETEALKLYQKEVKVISEDQLIRWLEGTTLSILAKKISEAGGRVLIGPKDLGTLEAIAGQSPEYICWVLDALNGIAMSQAAEGDANLKTALLPKRTGESEKGESVNGSYIVKILSGDSVIPAAIMKPADEETGAPNCPTEMWRDPSECAFTGIMPGEGPMREHIAYLLGGELGVPYTISCEGVVCSEFIGENKRKTVSLQCFVPNSKNFDRELTDDDKIERLRHVAPENIRSLALLDLRLFNSDRGPWNVMITADNQLVPIDHGATLSTDMISDRPYFCWMEWDQAHTALSDENRAYIERMNWSRDKKTILTLYPDFPPDSLRTAQFGYELLKAGQKYDLTPYEMGLFFIGDEQKISPSHLLLESLMKANDETLLPNLMDKYIAIYSKMRALARGEVEKLSADFPRHKKALHSLFFAHSNVSDMREPLISRLFRESANADFANMNASVMETVTRINETLAGFERLFANISDGQLQEALKVHFLGEGVGAVSPLLKLASELTDQVEIADKVQKTIQDCMDYSAVLEKEIAADPSYAANREKIKDYVFGKNPKSETPPIFEFIESYKNKSQWNRLIRIRHINKVVV